MSQETVRPVSNAASREHWEALLEKSSYTTSKHENDHALLCCVCRKQTREMLGKYFIVKGSNPHEACRQHQMLLPDEPKINGETNYLDYIPVSKEFAEYAARELDIINNLSS